ncbi:MAG: methyltransferase domain-containing protein [Actinomycetota bacterium]|nr:methyltransferase domain-containing protein [Actinomycetota bacterium]
MTTHGLTDGLDAAQVKACCATGYASDVMTLLLGSSYHPGGTALTRRLLDLLGLEPSERLVDVASGIGTSSLLAAQEYGVQVHGVDLSEANVKLATGAAVATDLTDRATFHHGDAEALPLPDGGWDAVICECALCTFPDKATAIREMARVLRPGGQVGISDITADRDRLPAELTGIAAWVACIADARTTGEYRDILTTAGLRVTAIEHHTQALERMIHQIAARLDLLKMIARPKLEALRVDFARTGPVLETARAAIRDGVLDYVLITAEKQ